MTQLVPQVVLSAMLAISVTGCSSIPFLNNDEPDYKKSGSSRPLEVPPDLTDTPTNDAYSIPGSTTYSKYSKNRAGQQEAKKSVLATPDNVKMVKAGGQRWLEVEATPEAVWPVIREFWEDQGFAVRKENPQIGVMETEWINPDKLNLEEKGNYGERFDRWLDGLSGLTNRKKFKTRIERGERSGITEIYMTHRSVDGAPDDGKERIQTQLGEIELGYKKDARKRKLQDATDEEIDAELLRRLMVKLGIKEEASKTVVANTQLQKRANVIKNDDGSATIEVLDAYDRAWRRVGLAIDRVGFVIEDKNRSEGLFYVRYADVDIDTPDKKKKGLIETLKFWKSDEDEDPVQKEKESVMEKLKFWGKDDTKKTATQGYYRVKVAKATDSTSIVNVVDDQNAVMKTRTANRIVALIYEQLR